MTLCRIQPTVYYADKKYTAMDYNKIFIHVFSFIQVALAMTLRTMNMAKAENRALPINHIHFTSLEPSTSSCTLSRVSSTLLLNMRISYYSLVALVLQYIHFISLIELLYLLPLNYPTQFFFQFASRILLKHPDHTQSTDQTQARRILQSFTRKPPGLNTFNLAPYNSTMPQDPSKQAAQCCRIYHILSRSREILTTQLEPRGCSCSKPLNNVAFACRDCAGAMGNVLNHQLTHAEKMQLGWAENQAIMCNISSTCLSTSQSG